VSRSRFTAIVDELTAVGSPAIYPSQRLRLSWRAFRRVFDELSYRTVWQASPGTLAAIEQEPVSIDLFRPLATCGAPLLPRFVSAVAAAEAAQVTRLTAFGWLEIAYAEFETAFANDRQATTEHRIAAVPLDTASARDRGQRHAEFERLIAAARQAPAEIAAVLLQGSLADGRIEDGFSDADLVAIVESPSRLTRQGLGESFAAAARWLLTFNRELLAYNPLMHHGPTATFRLECERAAEAAVPSAVFDHGCWLHGSTDRIRYHDGELENVLVFGVFEPYFEAIGPTPHSIRDGFDALWWVSNTLILPVLAEQLETRRSVWKRDCLESRRPVLSPESWAVISEVEAVRVHVARCLRERIGNDETLEADANPGILTTRARAQTRLSDAERTALGLTETLFDGVRGVWEEAAARALSRHAGAVARAGRDAQTLIAWPIRTSARPRPLTSEAYADARTAMLARCNRDLGVRAVYQFGAIECPGLSDLDLLVVLDDAVSGVPEPLRLASVDPQTAYVLDHDPLFVGEAAAPLLAAVFPLFGARQVWGDVLHLPVSEDYAQDVRLSATTALNLRKYDDDVAALSQAVPTPWRTVLAYLHSVVHLERGAVAMGCPVPVALRRASRLDADIRQRFTADQVATQADLRYALHALSEAAGEVRALTVNYWRHRCSGLRDLLETDGGLRSDAVDLGATWLRAMLSGVGAGAANPHPSEAPPPFHEYLALKHRFMSLEAARQRDISPYVRDPILSELTAGTRPTTAARRRTELHAVSAWLGQQAAVDRVAPLSAHLLATDRSWLELQAADLTIAMDEPATSDAIDRTLDSAAAQLPGDGRLALTLAPTGPVQAALSETAAALARHPAFHQVAITPLPGDSADETDVRVGVHARRVPRDVAWQFGAAWHDEERVGALSHRWSAGRSSMRLWTASPGALWIDADLYSLIGPNLVEVWAADQRIAEVPVNWEGFAPIRLGPFVLEAGRHELWWQSISGPWYVEGDSRALAFAVRSVRLSAGHEPLVPGEAERG
jgi:predicted nucleotidyltransferase